MRVAEAGSQAIGEPSRSSGPMTCSITAEALRRLAEARPGRNAVAGAGSDAAGRGAGPHVLAIGTGINVNQRAGEFPAELSGCATSLRVAARDRVLDRSALLAAVLARFDAYRLIATREGADALRLALLPHLPTAGSPIVVQTAERRLEGTVEQILENGALLVRDQSGGRFPVWRARSPSAPGSPREVPSCGHQEDKSRLAAARRGRPSAAGASAQVPPPLHHLRTIETTRFFVIKKDGRREPFSREKILERTSAGCEKRPIAAERSERVDRLAGVPTPAPGAWTKCRRTRSGPGHGGAPTRWMKWRTCGSPPSTGTSRT